MWAGSMAAVMLVSMVACPLQRSFLKIQHPCILSFRTARSCDLPRNYLSSFKHPFFQTSALRPYSLDRIPSSSPQKFGALVDGEDSGVETAPEEERDLDAKKRSTRRRVQLLTNKERKELRAYAHGLGTKLVSQQVGKAGVTQSLSAAIKDTLEANEVMKVRVLDNCPDELEEVIEKLEETTEAQIVGKTGNTLLLYRPSLQKMAAAERQNNDLHISRKRKSSKPSSGIERSCNCV